MSNEEKAPDPDTSNSFAISVEPTKDYILARSPNTTVSSIYPSPIWGGYDVQVKGPTPSMVIQDEMVEDLDLTIYVLVEADGSFTLFSADKLAEHLSRREDLGRIAIQEWFYDGTNDDFDKTS